MKQKISFFKAITIIVFVIIFVLSATACTSANKRVQEALDKVKGYSAVELKGTAKYK